jgi:hypothetical protein
MFLSVNRRNVKSFRGAAPGGAKLFESCPLENPINPPRGKYKIFLEFSIKDTHVGLIFHSFSVLQYFLNSQASFSYFLCFGILINIDFCKGLFLKSILNAF